MALFAAEIPLTPDADTARQWVEDELQKPVYQQGESLADRFAQWLSDWIEELLSTSGTANVPVLGYLLGAVIFAVLLVLAVRFWAPALRQGRKRKGDAVLEDDFRTADEIDAAADSAERGGLYSLAVLERYRAIVRRSEERVLIDDRAGRTALEAARDIGATLPDFVAPLLDAADLFGAVLYGHRDATAADAQLVSSLAKAIARARPLAESSLMEVSP